MGLSVGSIKPISRPDLIKRFPFNGRSKYLIDRFYIIGYRPSQLHKILFDNPQNKNNLKNMAKKIIQEEMQNLTNNTKSQFSLNSSKNPTLKITIEESPSLLNEISSDTKKELPDIDLIKNMLFPNKIKIYIKSTIIRKRVKSTRRERVQENLSFSKRGSDDILFDKNNDYIINENDDINNNPLKILNSKQYNMVFSYNPQTGKDSKKSINGFAYVFYKELNETLEIGEVKFTFYIPVTFCIISEFPYFNSYYRLCKQIIALFQNDKNEIPLEIVIYNIINFCLSPLNGEINLNIEPIIYPTEKIVINTLLRQKKKQQKNNNKNCSKDIQIIKEEQEPEDDYDNPFKLYETEIEDIKNDKETKIKKGLQSPNLNEKKLNHPQNLKELGYKLERKNDINGELLSSLNLSPKKSINKRETFFINSPRNTLGFSSKNSKLLNLEDDFDINNDDSKNSKNMFHSSLLNPIEEIKFPFLSGYPLIQYNLPKILLYKLSPQDVIITFFYSFLEKDIIFFSKNLEYLSLTINSYLNLNFPLNDEKYYYFNACVSYDNYINDNSPFVGTTFTSMLGINSSYNPDYLKKTKPKEHLAVDLDKGVIYINEDPNDKDKNMKNKVLFDYIKKICKKEIKDDKSIILLREVKILYEKLEQLKNDISSNSLQKAPSNISVSTKNMIRINSMRSKNNFIDYDDFGQNCIKNKNRNIQEGFYRLINHLCLYFYQNLSLKSDADKEDLDKIIINRKNKGLSTDTMNIIFHKDYDTSEYNYIKEEIYLLDELMETMKFESFVYGFIQSYNPIDLYKIPLTMTEEFISILSRKNTINQENINFFSLIDNIYKKNGVEKLYIDFNPFSSEYHKKIKKYFDREIYDENNNRDDPCRKKIVKEKFVKVELCQKNEGEIINNIKYNEFILDNHLLLKYIRFLKNIKKEDYYRMFHLVNSLEQNKIKSISITDIENEIEKYSYNLDILSKRDICCSNVILLFILSIRTIKNYYDFQSFLIPLFQNFNVFRKYYTMILNLLYRLMNECSAKEDYISAKNYFFCYYSCINSLRALKLVPNENLMNIILKFDKIDLNDLLTKSNNSQENEKKNLLLDEHMKHLVDTNKYMYVIYNFTKNYFIKEKNIIQKMNEKKGIENLKMVTLNKEGTINKTMQPKIKFNNGIFQYECYIYSQDKILEDLNKQYLIYSKDLDENKLNNQILFEACLNIILFTRNTNFFEDNDDLIEAFKVIFNVYLFKIMNMNKKNNNEKSK